MKASKHIEVKQLIRKIILFLLAFVLLDVISAVFLEKLLVNQSRGDYQKFNYLFNESQDQIIFLGNSRVEHQIVPQVVEETTGLNAYNAGIGGRDILFSNAVLDVLLERHQANYLVLEMQWANLFDPVKEDRMSFLNPYYFSNPELQKWLNEGRIDKHFLYHSSFVRYNSTLWDLLTASFTSDEIDRGYKPLRGNLENRSTITSPNKGFPEKLNPRKVQLYKDFINKVLQSESQLIVIVTPNFNPKTIDSHQELGAFIQFLEKNRIPLLDFGDREEYKNNKSVFYDVRHLNHEGAVEFTSMLCDSLTPIVNSDQLQ